MYDDNAQDIRTRHEAALRFVRDIAPTLHDAFLNRDFAVDWKGDASPVTEIDRGTEQRLRDLILEEFPHDAILGEEFDDHPGTSGYRWILDPIDGTRPFIHGVPIFGSLVGIDSLDTPVVGVCAVPGASRQIFHGYLDGDGSGADAYTGGVIHWDGEQGGSFPIQRGSVTSLADATVCYTQLDLWTGPGEDRLLKELVSRCKLVRGWGDCFGHMLVASGSVEIMIDTQMSLWDAAALQPIVEASGAAFFSLEGERRIDAGSAISCHPALKEELLALIAECRSTQTTSQG